MIKYCIKQIDYEGKEYYSDIYAHIQSVKMCCNKQEPIYKIDIKKASENEDTKYIGWLEPNGEISMIYPRLFLFDMCFPYGYKIAEKNGEGKKINIMIEEKCTMQIVKLNGRLK